MSNCPVPNVPPGVQDVDINAGNTDNNAEAQDDIQEQQQPQAGPSGVGAGTGEPAGDNIPNALTSVNMKGKNFRISFWKHLKMMVIRRSRMPQILKCWPL